MAKQAINVGTVSNDRTGDPLRTAFQKVNANFTELYNTVDALKPPASRTWADVSTGTAYSVVEWTSGAAVQITPTETYTLTTYDARTDSQAIYFVWDASFIDGVWNGYTNPLGEGMSYEISLDDNSGAGSVQAPQYSFSGNNVVQNDTNYTIGKVGEAADAGRLYCNFDNGRVGEISLYWNAKLFTRS